MAETIANNATIASEETPAPEENPPVVATNEAPAPKKRGRPAGAKDKAPRVKKAIVIVEEPLHVPEPEKKPPRVKKARPPTPPESESEEEEESSEVATPPVAQAHEPPKPRDVYKEASKMIFQLQSTKNDARRSRLQEQYTKGLLAL